MNVEEFMERCYKAELNQHNYFLDNKESIWAENDIDDSKNKPFSEEWERLIRISKKASSHKGIICEVSTAQNSGMGHHYKATFYQEKPNGKRGRFSRAKAEEILG